MSTVINTEQAAAWNGYEGRHWAEYQDRYDAVNAGFNRYLLDAARLDPDSHVLDVGCGNGQLTREFARRVPAGSATGVDLSAPMLARARATAAAQGLTNVSFMPGDAQTHPFPAYRFDLATSRFGVMFFADPVAAFANIGTALRPGGRLAMLTMRSLADHELGSVLAALGRAVPGVRTGPGGGPESLADPKVIETVLTSAGYTDVDITPVDATQEWGRDAADAAEFLLGWGPIHHLLGAGDPDTAARARSAATEALREYEQADGVRMRGAAWLVGAGRN